MGLDMGPNSNSCSMQAAMNGLQVFFLIDPSQRIVPGFQGPILISRFQGMNVEFLPLVLVAIKVQILQTQRFAGIFCG